ncbi:MAG: T9SS type A sorting domain-containing protein, partial [Bacteroidales bacterium]|nr:T9SS type A sorting domain-containing protein [Bacteroidales bacterium]
AIIVVASGFLEPTNNSNSANTFGLYVAVPSGGALLPLPLFTTSVTSTYESSSEINVYPNPARDIVNIVMNMDEPAVDLQIVDATGRIIRSSMIQGSGLQTQSFDVSSLKPGFYLVRIVSDNYQHTEKVFVGR